MKIANVIYKDDLVNHTVVDYVNYIKEPIAYDGLDKSLTTLYVGWSFMKFCNPTNEIIINAEVLNKSIILNELYWECSFNENKSLHVKGIDSFVEHAPYYYFNSKYKYVDLDPVFFKLKNINDLICVLPQKIDKLYNLKNEVIYLLSHDDIGNKVIMGINLSMFTFFKFIPEEILNNLNIRTTTSIIDLDGETYLSYYKIFPNFIQLKRYLVAILNID